MRRQVEMREKTKMRREGELAGESGGGRVVGRDSHGRDMIYCEVHPTDIPLESSFVLSAAIWPVW